LALRVIAGPFGGWTAAEVVIFIFLLLVLFAGRSIRQHAAVLAASSAAALGLITSSWPFVSDALLLLALAAVSVEALYILFFPDSSKFYTRSAVAMIMMAQQRLHALLKRI
jgi:hypothetical protein